jgi:hypothetical protein
MNPEPSCRTGDELVAKACRIFDGLVLSVEPDENEQRLGMRHFLGWWFAKCNPALFGDLRALRKPEDPWTERVHLDDIGKAADILLRWNETRCVYFGVCPRKSADQEARRGKGVACVPGFWTDIDSDTPDILQRLRTFAKPPDHIVHSGHGFHAYWRFDTPVDPTPALKHQLKVLARVLGGDPACAEFARVMRVPFPWNRKRTPHVQARIVP